MAKNLEQHYAFHAGFEALEAYFSQVQKDPSVYDREKAVAMLDEFGCTFVDHLNDEIRTLEPEKMRKIFADPMEAKEIDTRMVKWIVDSSNPTTDVPFVTLKRDSTDSQVMNHHDVITCPWWPWRDIPYFVIFLGRYVFPWRHSR